MRDKYFISLNSGVSYSEIFPSNDPIIKIGPEPGEFFKRAKIDHIRLAKIKNPIVVASIELMFFNSLFGNFQVLYRVDVNGTPEYHFKDTLRRGHFNKQNKVYDANPEPDDSYGPILKSYQKKFSNVTGLFGLTQNFYSTALSGSRFVNSSFNLFSDPDGSLSYTHNGVEVGTEYAYSDITDAPDGTLLTVLVTGLTYTGTPPQMVCKDVAGGTEYSNSISIDANGKYEILISGSPGSIVLEFSVLNTSETSISGSLSYELYVPLAKSGGGSLYNILDRIINHTAYFDLDYEIVSTILWNDPLGTDPPEAIETYMTANPNDDYVIEDTAIFNYLYLGRTDVFTTNVVDNIDVSLKDIMDVLKTYRLWWFIDEDGKFRIEHEKYFRSYSPQADLTSVTFVSQKPEVDKRVYGYQIDTFNQVGYTENNQVNPDWLAVKMDFDPIMTSEAIKEVRTAITTDLLAVLNDPDGASNSGLILLRLDENDCIPLDESVVTAGNFYPNLKLSPAWMTKNYMNYFAESKLGTLITGNHSFTHCKETLKQKEIRFRMSAVVNYLKPITLIAGTGWIELLQYSPDTGMYSVDFGFDPWTTVLNTGAGPAGTSTTADSTDTTVDDTGPTIDSSI